jgi:hypothetical protein
MLTQMPVTNTDGSTVGSWCKVVPFKAEWPFYTTAALAARACPGGCAAVATQYNCVTKQNDVNTWIACAKTYSGSSWPFSSKGARRNGAPPPFYANIPGASRAIKTCPNGQWYRVYQEVSCPQGHYRSGTECKRCPPGHVQNQSAFIGVACTACPYGMAVKGHGVTQAVECGYLGCDGNVTDLVSRKLVDSCGVCGGDNRWKDSCGVCGGGNKNCGGCTLAELGVYSLEYPSFDWKSSKNSKIRDSGHAIRAAKAAAAKLVSSNCSRCADEQSVMVQGQQIMFTGNRNDGNSPTPANQANYRSAAQVPFSGQYYYCCPCAKGQQCNCGSSPVCEPSRCLGKVASNSLLLSNATLWKCDTNFVTMCASNGALVMLPSDTSGSREYLKKTFGECLKNSDKWSCTVSIIACAHMLHPQESHVRISCHAGAIYKRTFVAQCVYLACFGAGRATLPAETRVVDIAVLRV